MNTVQLKNNIYKNGEWRIDRSKSLAWAKAQSIEPSTKQVEYRDALHKFCVQEGLIKDSFKLQRTKRGISSNIQAFLTIIKKNGLADKFFGERKDEC